MCCVGFWRFWWRVKTLFFNSRAPKKFKLSKIELISKAKKFKVHPSLSKKNRLKPGPLRLSIRCSTAAMRRLGLQPKPCTHRLHSSSFL